MVVELTVVQLDSAFRPVADDMYPSCAVNTTMPAALTMLEPKRPPDEPCRTREGRMLFQTPVTVRTLCL